jgi:prolipoprotein diacylglyceryltransferase/protein-S-isoprenylcysteine O-methyltransferase Ste14
MRLAKVLYGALFVVLVPCFLVLWAIFASGNVRMPVYGNSALGALFALAGLALMFAAMFELWHFGGGLPMNAFPPPRLVARGTFRLFPHPIYTGFVVVCLGVSMAARSPSGLWLITPIVALACATLVFGYERPDLQRRFGQALQILPPDDDAAPSTLERVRFLLLVLLPWIALYELMIRLPLHGIDFGFSFENRLPIFPWTTPIYQSTYVMVAAAPWFARTRRDLRKLMISGWTATALIFPFYWLIPSSAPRRPLFGHNWMVASLNFERNTYPPAAAFPSFHVIWALVVVRVCRPLWIGVTYVVAVSVSCVTTGMHYIPDVLFALAIAPLIDEPGRVWILLRSATERLANSWREWRFGSVRLINHSFYAAAAAFVQLVIVMGALGPGREWEVLVTAFAGLILAGAWAQLVEGSSRLKRPFGFYGGLIGVAIACLFFRDRWLLLAANCVAAPWLQAIGRLRCLVNGCCHGRPTAPEIGIRVTHPRSRVSHLAELAGVPIHATQLYSILGNVFLGLLLARLWISHCPLTLIIGVYAIGNGAARFAEEAYRGEPQTPTILGLRLYQWMAIATVIIGAVFTCFRSSPGTTWNFTLTGLWLSVGFAIVAGVALGVDFPQSDRTLARLT